MSLVYQAETSVPVSREAAFAMAADIEAYPDFLPMCRATRITVRDGDRLSVDNLFGFGPVSARFTSHAALHPPGGLEVTSEDGPFERLAITWRFDALSEAETQVNFRFEAAFRSPLQEAAARAVSDRLAQRVLDAFSARLDHDQTN